MATRQTKKKSSYTVFDTIYRTMVQKYPQLVIPLINNLNFPHHKYSWFLENCISEKTKKA